jgi:DNA-binding NarL/FixJ family response regulator
VVANLSDKSLQERGHRVRNLDGASAYRREQSVICQIRLVRSARPPTPPAAIAAELSPTASTLTRRELEVLQLLASGIPNKEIAARLGMATKTTMHHTSKIYSKLGVRGRGEAAA